MMYRRGVSALMTEAGRTAIVAALAALVISAAAGAQEARDPGATVQPGVVPIDRVVAVVGSQPILWSDVLVAVNQKRARGMPFPADSASQMAIARETLNDLVDAEILVQKARQMSIEVEDAEVQPSVEQQIRGIRSQFPNDSTFRAELRAAGLGTPEEYRRTLTEQMRRQSLQQRAFEELRKQLKPASVTEAEITTALEASRAMLLQRPATITFRQIVVAPKASAASRARARAKAESLLVEIRRGGDFEAVARRESMDPGSRELGGDLGWNRRGSGLVPEFERVVFAMNPGQVSPIVETTFGYHIIRVDRVQPAEVKARHILIRPQIDSADVALARADADTVAARLRRGDPFDDLIEKYHDPSEERGILQPYPRDSLPPSYLGAIAGKTAGEVTAPFTIGTPGAEKFGVLQIVTLTEGGQFSESEVREQIRQQLIAERATREMLDALRRETFVSLRL